MYSYGYLYQILDKYIENSMEETEHGFIPGIKWPDNYVLKTCSEEFWTEIEAAYDVHFTEQDIRHIKTVGDLKKEIVY